MIALRVADIIRSRGIHSSEVCGPGIIMLLKTKGLEEPGAGCVIITKVLNSSITDRGHLSTNIEYVYTPNGGWYTARLDVNSSVFPSEYWLSEISSL